MDALTCRRCGAEIAGSEVHESLQVARCSRCNTVMDLAARGPVPVSPSKIAASRPMTPLPDRFDVTEDGVRLRIAWRWWNLVYVPLILFCMFWDGFLLLWYGIAFASLVGGDTTGGILMFVFPLLHVAVGVGLTYSVLGGLFNSTTVEAGNGVLLIRHGPIPWRGNLDVATADLEQIFCRSRRIRRKNGYYYRYDVLAADREGRERVLLKGLEHPEQALYLEQKLEAFLGITDRPVSGEMARRG